MYPFSEDRSQTIAALGERRLLDRIRRWLGEAMPPAPLGMGDDCAVLPAPRAGRRCAKPLLTVDPVIYGEHFNDAVPPRAAGRKLLARNLSDIAAMGGSPEAAVVSLALDPRTRLDWLEAFYRGLAALAREHGVPVVGGDLATNRGGIVASLTLLGRADAGRAVTRSGARAGDFLAVTGRLGGSLPSGRHWRFAPRLAEGRWLAARREVTAMMDVSDGLAKDLWHLVPAGATPLVFGDLIPRHRACDLRAALCDGEDYELLCALRGSPARIAALAAAWTRDFPKTPFTVIGRLAPADSASAGALDLSAYHAFEHFV